jgi:CheY-like chemotaxis protein
MDQMMPKIDGIQTTKIIKDMGYKNPIVALTANVIKGQADMFLEHGFDDFIAKPIDIRQMNTVLNKFVRDRHPEAALTAESGVISKKKAQIGSGMNDAIKEKVKTAFVRDATKAVEALKKINKKRFPLDKDDIRVFDTFVHGMKGALTIIGQTELSAIASELEMSVQNGETEIDTAVTAAFVDSLRILIDEMKQSKTNKSNKVVNEDKDFLREKLLVLKAACDDLDEDSIDDVMAQLGEKTWSEPTAKLIDTIAGHLLHSDFTKIEEVVKKYLGK